ncbi:alpha/beta hydrolase [Nonomuraea sp. NPDC005501]|uniref:alpha/beta hydrolase n=1 Tax=Nonomuraea sp. NPDC005501 TaxID=3156884 RepID=UPI0033B644B7
MAELDRPAPAAGQAQPGRLPADCGHAGSTSGRARTGRSSPLSEPRGSARAARNVLLIQNRRDPSTPCSGALKMREAMMTDKFATDIVLEAAELFSRPSYPTLM